MARQLTEPETEILFKKYDEIYKKAYSRFKRSIQVGLVAFACTAILGVSSIGKSFYDKFAKTPSLKETVTSQREYSITDCAPRGVLIGSYACLASFFYGMHSLSPRTIKKKRQKALQNIIQES